ncbi:Arabinanase/levansucrase/invertase [Neocallimastix sp. 'constans']|jgi:beta-xylosidase
MKYYKLFLNIFIILFVGTAVAQTTVRNPIIWADVPDDDIIRVDDTYYMVSTTMFFSPGAPIMKSKDLFSWEICNYVYDILADGDVQTLKNGKHDYSHGQWAASLRYHEGTFYVFFGSYGTNKSYIFKTKDIEKGTWTRNEIFGMYHDASILFDDDGRKYLVYGGSGEIKIKEFNNEMTDFKRGGADKVLFRTGLSGLAGEGSHIQKIGKYYYIFIIAWPNGKGRIEICYRSRDLLGNYENKIVLDSGLGSYGSGVAQGGIVDTPDGKWYGLLFQDHGSVGRIPVLVPVNWQNDWPIMGVNGKAPLTFQIEGNFKGTQLAKSDDFDYSSNRLSLEWQWNHNPDNTAWSVTDRPGWLRLKNKYIAPELLKARNTLTMRTEGPACSGVVKLDTSNMKVGDYAGLSAFQYNYGNVGVYVADNGERRIYMASNGGYNGNADVTNSRNNIVQEVKLNGKEIYLKTDFRFSTVKSDGSASNNIDKVNFYYSLDGNQWNKIGKEIGMTYDLKLFTGYRNALFSYPTKNTGGYADFDYFEYQREEWNSPNFAEEEKEDPNGYLFHNTFERGIDGWSSRGSAQVSFNKNTAYDGNGSIYCSERGANWSGASRNLSPNVFKPGNAYSFSVVVKYEEGPASQIFYLTLQYDDGSGETQYEKVSIVEVAKGQWTQLYNTNYKIPDRACNMLFYVETEKGEDSFYVDEAIGAPAGTAIDGPKSSLTPSNNSSLECFSTKLGYPCCQQTKDVVYEDNDGQWGVENNDWCGITKESASSATCWSTGLGYPCCSLTNTDVYYIDESGNWGIENDDWCGISN